MKLLRQILAVGAALFMLWPALSLAQSTVTVNELGVMVVPEFEHWPSNYWPRGYTLKGYDQALEPVFTCQGTTGKTFSTSRSDCPPGQKPTQHRHRWSSQ